MKMRLTLLFFNVLCLGASFNSFSQVFKFRHITVDEGLPVNTIFGFAQDSLGFIWMATVDGLCRYDGHDLKTYKHDPNDSTSLHYDAIRCIYVDANNNLWFGSKGGLGRFDPVTQKFAKIPQDSTNKTGITVDNTSCILGLGGKIYFGTLGGGLNIYDPVTGKYSSIRNDPKDPRSLPSDNIRGLSADSKGNIWIATLNAGIAKLDPATGICDVYTAQDGLPANETRTIFVDSQDDVWISCWNAGITVRDNATGKFKDPKDASQWFGREPWGLVSMFAEDRKGKIWTATAEHGIGCYDPIGKTHQYFEYIPEDPHSISDKTVFAIMEDRSGVIWAGTWHGGVNIYDPSAHLIKHYRIEPDKENTLNSNGIWRILKLRSGKYLVGTAKFINEFDEVTNTFSSYYFEKGNDNSPSEYTIAQALLEDYDGNIWIGSNGAGAYKYSPDLKKYIQYRPSGDSNSFPYHTVMFIMEDLNRDVWFATPGGGICRYNKEKNNFSQFNHIRNDSTSISSDYIFYMLLRKDGRFWLATDKGLDLFSPVSGEVIRYRNDPKDTNSITYDGIPSLAYSKDGILWIGTGAGLCSYDEGLDRFKRYTPANSGFPEVEISGIVEDDEGILWLTCNTGMYTFNPANKIVRKFETADGLQSREFALNCVIKDEKGFLFAGGVNGFNIIDPQVIRPNSTLPKVVFTGFSVLNLSWSLPQSIEYTKEITLSYREYFFSIHFAGLEFSDPSRNRYKYFLEGLTEDWIDLGNTRFVTFTNLDPGEYTLKVKASNNHGVWNEQSADILIIITPPFYKTKWFYALSGIIIISSIYGFIKWRERKLREEKAHLENVVETRTHELREEKEKVDAAHKDIRDSINYAKRIQEATLPLVEEIQKELPGSFVLFKPRDIVSGDFYWFDKQGSLIYLAAADCTGHGVPGALMSMIGSSALHQVLLEEKKMEPGEILTKLNVEIRNALKQNMAESETRDGMDIALISFDTKTNEIKYSGANRPFYYVRKEIPEVEEIRADKFPIGGAGYEQREFHTHTIKLNKGDTFYIFSDGYPDQFGGDTGKKFMTKNFKRMLMLYNRYPVMEIRKQLDDEFEIWRGNNEQVDDVLVIGVRV